MNLYVATVDRFPNPNYLESTIRSLAASDQQFGRVLLCAGGPQVSHLAALPEDLLTGKMPVAVHDVGPAARACIDGQADAPSRYAATMLHALCSHDYGAVCWADDDICFHQRFFDWMRRAATAVRLAVMDTDRQFVLSLFSAGETVDRTPWPPADDRELFQEETARFGSLFLCFAGGCAAKLAHRAYELHVGHRRTNPHHGMDLCLRESAREHGVPWFTTTWSLVQHIGHVSSGCSGVCVQVYSPVYLGDQAGAGDR